MPDTPIAIVGAGPVGLVLALRLATLGVPSVVLEAEADISEELRASTFHPPTLDMLDALELAAPLAAQGLVTRTWQIRRHEDGARAVFDLSVLKDDTAHPYRLQAEQWKLSRLILPRLSGLTELRFNARVEAVAQDADGVTLTLASGEILRAPYAVGCDGARSAVRKAMGLEFSGDTYPETTILATTTFPFHDALEGLSNVNYVWTDHPAFSGTFSLLRVPADGAPACTPRRARAWRRRSGPRRSSASCRRSTRSHALRGADLRPYRIHQRIVPDYRRGGCCWRGTPPTSTALRAGWGMNGGIHDAMELAAHLAPVWRGEADAALLDRYTRRRRPVAEREIIAQADRNRARMRETDPARRAAMLAERRRWPPTGAARDTAAAAP
jgi:3-(3-hydroxy-phenyl)propionate hydroxylase